MVYTSLLMYMESETVELALPRSLASRRPTKAERIRYEGEKAKFADQLVKLAESMIDKWSSRGWCYLLESWHLIDKSQFDYAQGLINDLRKEGLIPIDFVASDISRECEFVEEISEKPLNPSEYVIEKLERILGIHEVKSDISFWDTQEYYIQMLVEKVDVKKLFSEICMEYHIPIANARGWSDIMSRYEMMKRFKEAEMIGLKPVLLYYGDFDPTGLLISDKLMKNFKDIEKGAMWNPDNLIVDRVGINIDFIEKHGITWIPNLMTGGKKTIRRDKKYVQDYIAKYGENKVEANAILPKPTEAIEDLRLNILKYLGEDPLREYKKKVTMDRLRVREVMGTVGMECKITELIDKIDKLMIMRVRK